MSATAAVKEALDMMRPEKGETVEALAKRMYWEQQHTYDLYSGNSLAPAYNFSDIKKEYRDGYLAMAKEKMQELSATEVLAQILKAKVLEDRLEYSVEDLMRSGPMSKNEAKKLARMLKQQAVKGE